MPRISNGGSRRSGVVASVPGLYVALLDRERRACAEVDPRTLPCFNPHSEQPRTVVETGSRSPTLLAALEAGETVMLHGRSLRGHRVPVVPLRRDQAFDWFHVSADDQVWIVKP